MQQAPAVFYVGLRADEEEREGGDYLQVPNVHMRFPLREAGFGLSEVWQFLRDRNQNIPVRTDCKFCFFQRLIEWFELWQNDPDAYAEAENLEAITGHTWRSPSRDSWPTSLEGLRIRFEAGQRPNETRKGFVAGLRIDGDRDQCRVCRK
jgi:hypothetical protein